MPSPPSSPLPPLAVTVPPEMATLPLLSMPPPEPSLPSPPLALTVPPEMVTSPLTL